MTVKELKEMIAQIDPALDELPVRYVDFSGYDVGLHVFVDDTSGIAISGE